MTLADTSVCIPYLRGTMPESEHADFVERMIRRELGITSVVWVELFQGIRSKREEQELANFVEMIHFFEFDQKCWNETARIARICKKRGVNAPLSDIQIQACALSNNLELLHHDKHFGFIQKVLPK